MFGFTFDSKLQASTAVCERHGKAGAGDERSQERCAERASRTVCLDRRHLFLKLPNSLNSRCPMGTSFAVDAVGNSNQVESLAVIRCATTKSRTTTLDFRNGEHSLAGS